jgi:hypothetical protein
LKPNDHEALLLALRDEIKRRAEACDQAMEILKQEEKTELKRLKASTTPAEGKCSQK